MTALQVTGVVTLLGFILGVGGIAYAYNTTEIPRVRDDVQAQTTTVLWADGSPMGRFKAQDRTIVTSDQIPDLVKDSFVAAEDRSFYDNRGVSVTGIGRAVWGQVTGNDAGGGSTITQQYVRNYFSGLEDRSWRRKAKEILLAAKIERREDKQEIITNYLNTIYFGRKTYGIEAASRSYFGKDVSQLDQSEAAFLAGILPSPERLDPTIDGQAPAAQARFEYVLDGLVANGKLTQAQADALPLPTVLPEVQDDDFAGPNGFVLDMVRKELQRLGYAPDDVDRAGLTVTTTLSPGEQQKARDAVYDGLAGALTPEGALPPGLRVGLASIDPATGEVHAFYPGSDDYLSDGVAQRNSVTDDRYQAGSTLKPFALVTALRQGIPLTKTYNGKSPYAVGENEFVNFGDQQFRTIDLVTATANSVNTVYVQLNEDVGAENTYQTMLDAGLQPGCPPDQDDGRCTRDLVPGEVGNILGSASPHLIDTAAAYATFAAQGIRRDWHVVRQVQDASGAVVRVADTTGTQAFTPEVMADTTYALSQVVQRGSGATEIGPYAKDRPVAGKTGTASDNKAASFAGYTPQLATVVGLWQEGTDATGAPTQESLSLPGFREITGGSYPARVWQRYAERALDGVPVAEFPEPTVKLQAPAPAKTQQRPATTQSQAPPPPEPEPTLPPSEEPTVVRRPTLTPLTTPPPTTASSSSPPPPSSTSSSSPSVPTVSSPSAPEVVVPTQAPA